MAIVLIVSPEVQEGCLGEPSGRAFLTETRKSCETSRKVSCIYSLFIHFFYLLDLKGRDKSTVHRTPYPSMSE